MINGKIIESMKNTKLSYEFSFKSSESPQEMLLAVTFEIKKFLELGYKISVEIPERVYLNINIDDFKEILSDQILELDSDSKNLCDISIIKANEKENYSFKESFKIIKIK